MSPALSIACGAFHSVRKAVIRGSAFLSIGSCSFTPLMVFGAALSTSTMLVVSNCDSPRLLISLAMRLLSVDVVNVSWKRYVGVTLGRASAAVASAVAPALLTSGFAVFTVGLILSQMARECFARARIMSVFVIKSALLTSVAIASALSSLVIA